MPSFSSSNCSLGSRRRGVKPAACRSRQKSLRGLAKCAFAAAETQPGLIPQKTAVSPRARTSGTSLSGCFRFSRIELVFEERPEQLAGDGRLVPGAAALDADHLHAVLPPPPVAPGVALGLAQGSEPLHEPHRTRRTGRHHSTIWSRGTSRAANVRASNASAGATTPVARASPASSASAPRTIRRAVRP
jgi:hypothetical protein